MGCSCSLVIDSDRPVNDEGATRYLGCRLGGGDALATTFCTGPSSYRLRPGDLSDDRMGWWAGVVEGDLVQAVVDGAPGPWWRVLSRRGEAVCIGGDGGVTFWAKPAPSQWEHAHGWHGLDPHAVVRIRSTGARIGGPSIDEAHALVRDVLGGKRIEGDIIG